MVSDVGDIEQEACRGREHYIDPEAGINETLLILLYTFTPVGWNAT